MRILLIGCGALGSALARGLASAANLTLYDTRADNARSLATEVGAHVATTLEAEALAAGRYDLVIEAASQAALRQIAPLALRAGRRVVALSVGALGNAAFLAELERLVAQHGGSLHVPSGAVGGLDALRAAHEAGLDEVVLTTTKPPAGVGLDAATMVEPQVLFDGPARAAVVAYPKNVNVAAAVALAGVGFDRTRVRLIADPAVERNSHQLEARGAFGRLSCTLENAPSPDNPASSHMAALSALALVRRLMSGLTIGT